MLKLTENALHLQCRAKNKVAAIEAVAAALEKAGYVKPDFLAGMLAREQQVTTYIGAGVAFPHCAKENLDAVIKTGFQVFQFPDGVSWGAGKVAFIVVAVAATPSEHLQLLTEIASLLSDEVKTTLLATAKTKADFIRLFATDSLP